MAALLITGVGGALAVCAAACVLSVAAISAGMANSAKFDSRARFTWSLLSDQCNGLRPKTSEQYDVSPSNRCAMARMPLIWKRLAMTRLASRRPVVW
jgi:hypothetical protein